MYSQPYHLHEPIVQEILATSSSWTPKGLSSPTEGLLYLLGYTNNQYCFHNKVQSVKNLKNMLKSISTTRKTFQKEIF